MSFWQILAIFSIIAILAFIFIPVYTHEGYASTKVVCRSNLKQIITATSIYALDSNDLVPPEFSFDSSDHQERFMAAILPYMKQPALFLCPKEQADKHLTTEGQEGLAGKMDYVHCLFLRGAIPDFSQGKRLLNIATIQNPETIPFLRDPIRGYGKSKNGDVVGFFSPHGASFKIAYLDGHVHSKNPVELSKDL